MKLTITTLRLDPDAGNVFEVKLPTGARVIGGHIVYESKRVLSRGPETKSLPVLVFECDPEAVTKRRRFLSLSPGMTLDLAAFGSAVEHRWTFISPDSGAPWVVYEAVER